MFQGSHKFTVPSKNVIESIAMSSAGDIRGAINALQFACLKGRDYLKQIDMDLLTCYAVALAHSIITLLCPQLRRS